MGVGLVLHLLWVGKVGVGWADEGHLLGGVAARARVAAVAAAARREVGGWRVRTVVVVVLDMLGLLLLLLQRLVLHLVLEEERGELEAQVVLVRFASDVLLAVARLYVLLLHRDRTIDLKMHQIGLVIIIGLVLLLVLLLVLILVLILVLLLVLILVLIFVWLLSSSQLNSNLKIK